jgi:hypothetical protein
VSANRAQYGKVSLLGEGPWPDQGCAGPRDQQRSASGERVVARFIVRLARGETNSGWQITREQFLSPIVRSARRALEQAFDRDSEHTYFEMHEKK